MNISVLYFNITYMWDSVYIYYFVVLGVVINLTLSIYNIVGNWDIFLLNWSCGVKYLWDWPLWCSVSKCFHIFNNWIQIKIGTHTNSQNIKNFFKIFVFFSVNAFNQKRIKLDYVMPKVIWYFVATIEIV